MGALILKAGDVVELKSSGPKMTIRWVENDEAYCEWFADKNELKGAKYLLVQLCPVPKLNLASFNSDYRLA